ncbi:MAG TPA: carboxypeptidase-like regulatory domain-containing protein [Candidatus Methanoperedens sp.]
MAFKWPYVTGKFTAYEGDKIKTQLSLALRLIDDYTKKEPIGRINVKLSEGEITLDEYNLKEKRSDIKPFKNPSGYYVFTDIPKFNYTLCIEPDFYFPEKQMIDFSKIKDEDVELKFDGNGPADKAISTTLLDTSKLEKDNIVEFQNPRGDIEQKKITNISNNTISWDKGLKYSYISKGSAVRVLKYFIHKIIVKPKPSYVFEEQDSLVRGLIYDSGNKPVKNAKVEVENKIATRSNKNGEFVLYFKESVDKIKIKINDEIQPDEIELVKGKTIDLGKIILH